MNEPSFWARFVVAVFAAWRVTHLLAYEDGPADLIVSLRRRLGSGFFGQLLDCFYCLSVWVAAPMALFVCSKPLEIVLTWLSLSGAACLLERMGQQPVTMQPGHSIEQGVTNDGMLRPEASTDAGRPDSGDDAGSHSAAAG